jgi:glycosyltransferase involved in cell wall biosynthesis
MEPNTSWIDPVSMIDAQPLLFSIVIPVHNREHLISYTVDSVLQQTYANYEIIVIDDSSTDNTPAILASYGKKINKLRLESRDPGINRNKGIELARGDYIAFLDSDDILLPWALQTYAAYLNRLSKPPILLAKAKGFRSNDEIPLVFQPNCKYQYYAYRDYLAKTNTTWLSTSHLIIKKSALGNPFCFHEKTFPFDDLDFILTLGCVGPFIQVESPVTVLHRAHEDNAVKNIKTGLQKLEYILERERQELYPGGHSRRVERLSIIGGHVLHWSRRAFKDRIFLAAFHTLFVGWATVLSAFFNKSVNLWFSRGKKASMLNGYGSKKK